MTSCLRQACTRSLGRTSRSADWRPPMPTVHDKRADLAGPGIGTYEEIQQVLPADYRSLLGPKDTQHAVHALKRFIEDGLCEQLHLFHVEVPLIVTRESGVNDYLD